jgi:hypothetical protein
VSGGLSGLLAGGGVPDRPTLGALLLLLVSLTGGILSFTGRAKLITELCCYFAVLLAVVISLVADRYWNVRGVRLFDVLMGVTC